jgi:hypothetical protein
MAWKWRQRPQRAGHFIKSFYYASRRAQDQAFFKPPAGRSSQALSCVFRCESLTLLLSSPAHHNHPLTIVESTHRLALELTPSLPTGYAGN